MHVLLAVAAAVVVAIVNLAVVEAELGEVSVTATPHSALCPIRPATRSDSRYASHSPDPPVPA